ncbi:MAG: hypothetical protein HYS27_18040 [Deltaproteobacteria bacterium]|nr:hypothetical protein [Deltaproteobacteria bacterium]
MLLAATLLRRHPLLIHLALLALAAIAAARLVTTMASLGLASVASIDAAPRADDGRAGVPGPSERDFDSARGLALFDVASEATTRADPAPARSCDDALDSELPLRLVGSALFASPTLALASIVIDERRGGIAEVYEPGDVIAERARLLEVDVEQACIENLATGAVERVTTAGPAPSRTSTPATATTSTPTAAGPTGDPVLDALLTGARATPRFEHGKLTGVRLSAIRPGSLYATAGLKNGDVVVAVNGESADDPGRALELWARLKGERTLELSVLRHGSPLSLTVALPTP